MAEDCPQVPSVTLYGTTQYTTTKLVTTTIVTSYLGEPAISLTTFDTSKCDLQGHNCEPTVKTSLVTTTPTVTSSFVTVVNAPTTVTDVIPQKTLYYPCTSTAAGGDKGSQNAQVPTRMDASTFAGAVTVAPSSSSSSSLTSQFPSPSSDPKSSGQVVSYSMSNGVIVGTPLSIASDTNIGSSVSRSPSASSSNASEAGANSSSSTSNTSHGAIIAGAIMGAILGLGILSCFIVFLRRRIAENREYGPEGSAGTVDYWERRFRELEAEGDEPDDLGKAEGAGASVSRVPSKKLRLTLDLASKTLPNEPPPSRLSMISAFFSSKPHPEPFRGGGLDKSGPLNFSRPRFGHARTSSKSSSKSRISHRSKAPSIKSLSTWLGFGVNGTGGSGGGSAKRSPATRGREITNEKDVGRAEGSGSGGRGERRAMEWIRGVEQAGNMDGPDDVPMEMVNGTGMGAGDNGGYPATMMKRMSREAETSGSPMLGSSFATSDIANDSPPTPSLLPPYPMVKAPSPLGRRLTPPKAKDATTSSWLPNELSNTIIIAPDSKVEPPSTKIIPRIPVPPPSAYRQPHPLVSHLSTATALSSVDSTYSTPSTEPSISASRPVTRDDLPTHPRIRSLSQSEKPSGKSLTSNPNTRTPSQSFRGKRESRGRIIPDLYLSREAITPSLWIDEEVYERFRNGQDESRFSPDSSSPAMSGSLTGDVYAGISTTPDTRGVLQQVSNSEERGLDSASSSSGDSTEEAPFAWVHRAERSAVTPQLPVVQFENSPRLELDYWNGQGREDNVNDKEERVVSIYQR